MGWGQGISVDYDESNELHNGHLAVVVEAGVFGLLSFYWVSAQPIFRQWAGAFGPNTKVARALVLSFLVAAAVVMIHNTLHRDRNFMLFLGIAATLRASESASTRSE
jgi:O-antigen ligase